MNKEVSIMRMFRLMPIKLHYGETKRKKNLSRLNLGLKNQKGVILKIAINAKQ